MRELTIRWRGPMTYRGAFYVLPQGLYMVVLGQDPLYLAASRDISRSLGSHLVFRRGRILPGDMIGRELLSWTNNYRQRMSVKLGEVFEGDRKVKDMTTLEDIVSLVAFNRRLPLNPYGRDVCEGTQMLKLTNKGKYFPLDDGYETDPETFAQLDSPATQQAAGKDEAPVEDAPAQSDDGSTEDETEEGDSEDGDSEASHGDMDS